MWNISASAGTGTLMHVFAGHGDDCTCGRFTLDGKRILTGSMDCTVRVWNPKSGECERVIGAGANFENGVTCLALSQAQENTLLVGSADATAALFNWTTGKLLGKLAGHEGEIEAVGICSVLSVCCVLSLSLSLSHGLYRISLTCTRIPVYAHLLQSSVGCYSE